MGAPQPASFQPASGQQYAPVAAPQQAPAPAPPPAPLPAMPASQPKPTPAGTTPKASRANTKPLIITAVVAGALFVTGMAFALFWPEKKAPVAPPPPETISHYYYVDSVAGESGKKDSFSTTFGFANPKTGDITKQTLQTTWPLLGSTAVQLSADGSRYAYATSDGSGTADPSKFTPENYQIITGVKIGEKQSEKILYAQTKRNDSRQWLLTRDGKELVYLDIVMNGKDAVTSDLYVTDTIGGKSTKIGAIDRPADSENTPLYDIPKDNSVRYYTSRDDGIYETRYDRKTRTLTNKKVVIRDYDMGHMGRLSPDGTKMLYFGNGTTNFTVYLLDLVEGGATPLLSQPNKYGIYKDALWAPDSKQIVLSAEIKDVDGKHYENQMLILDTSIKSKASDMILRNKSEGADNSASLYTITSWSPDGSYITFVQNGQLSFYAVKDKKTVDTVRVGKAIDQKSSLLGWTVKTKE